MKLSTHIERNAKRIASIQKDLGLREEEINGIVLSHNVLQLLTPEAQQDHRTSGASSESTPEVEVEFQKSGALSLLQQEQVQQQFRRVADKTGFSASELATVLKGSGHMVADHLESLSRPHVVELIRTFSAIDEIGKDGLVSMLEGEGGGSSQGNYVKVMQDLYEEIKDLLGPSPLELRIESFAERIRAEKPTGRRR